MTVERINRINLEYALNLKLEILESNSTGNFKVYKDNKNLCVWAFSYDTLIAVLDFDMKNAPLFTSYAIGYSNTTSKHTYNFMKEWANYRLSKDYCASWLHKEIKRLDKIYADNLNPYNVKNMHELVVLVGERYDV